MKLEDDQGTAGEKESKINAEEEKDRNTQLGKGQSE